MQNFTIMGVHWKIWFLGGGGLRKTNIGGGLPKKGEGPGQFENLRGGLGKWEGVVFLRGEGGDTPMHTEDLCREIRH